MSRISGFHRKVLNIAITISLYPVQLLYHYIQDIRRYEFTHYHLNLRNTVLIFVRLYDISTYIPSLGVRTSNPAIINLRSMKPGPQTDGINCENYHQILNRFARKCLAFTTGSLQRAVHWITSPILSKAT